MPAAMAVQQRLPGPTDAPVEVGERFAVHDRIGDRIAPEPRQGQRLGGVDLGDALPFPHPEAQLPETRFDFEGTPQPDGQLPGEVRAANQRGTDDDFPVAAVAHGGPHLFPTLGTQRIIHRPPKLLAALRLAVPQQIDGGEFVHAGDTPASAKVAMRACRAAAARRIGMATAAPLPSPKRIPRSSNGRASRASKMRRWPGSAEQ